MSDLSGGTTLVVGAIPRPGRAIATPFAEASAPVAAMARTTAALSGLGNGASTIRPVVAEMLDTGEVSVRGATCSERRGFPYLAFRPCRGRCLDQQRLLRSTQKGD